MTKTNTLFDDVAQVVGSDRVTSEEYETICYSHDLVIFPKMPLGIEAEDNFLLHMIPDMVVRPKDSQQIAKVVRLALENKVRITPRGGGCTGMLGSVPIKGGITMDLTSLNRLLGVDEKNMTCRVQAGMTLLALETRLNEKGYTVGIYPSSAPAATVGGWIAAGGTVGIGVSKYGSIDRHVFSLYAVMPDGELRQYGYDSKRMCGFGAVYDSQWDSHGLLDIDMGKFFGSDGTLGIITEVVLRIHPLPEKHDGVAFGFKSITAGSKAMAELGKFSPVYVLCMDSSFTEMANEVDGHFPAWEMIVFAYFDGTPEEVEKGLESASDWMQSIGGHKLPHDLVEHEWENRFKTEYSFKKIGPGMFIMDSTLTAGAIPEFVLRLRKISAANRIPVGFVGLLGENDKVMGLAVYPLNDRDLWIYLKGVSMIDAVVRAAFKAGGSTYGTGWILAPYLTRAQGMVNAHRMMRLKQKVDPHSIMNYKKVVKPIVPGFIFSIGMRLLGIGMQILR